MTETNESPAPGTAEPAAPDLDPAQVAYLQQRLLAEQNLALAVGAGALAGLVGAGLWALLTVATGYQIGFMAIGVGLGVGFAVRLAGRGVSVPFGVVGGAFALLGCAVGNLLAVTALVASSEGVPLLAALEQLDPSTVKVLMVATFSPMDLLFYGIALYEGYRLAFRQVGPDELAGMLGGRSA